MTTKVQKNIVDSNNENQIDPYSPLELLKNDRIREVILQMITEYVVDFRRHDALEIYLNAFHPGNTEDWNDLPFDGTNGLSKVLDLLGISSKPKDDFYDSLYKMAWDIIEGSENEANTVAVNILSRWTRKIKNYFSSKSKTTITNQSKFTKVSEEAILRLIEDNIIFISFSSKVDDLLSTLQPTTEGVQPVNNGIEPVLTLIGFEPGDLFDELFSFFYNETEQRYDRRPYKEVASIIYSGWLKIINEYQKAQ